MTNQRLETPPSSQQPGCFSSPLVLLQLVLHEFLCSHSIVVELRALLPELVHPGAPTLPRKTNEMTRRKIEECLNTLLTPADDRLLAHPWTPPKGLLSRLRAYAALLAIAMKGHEPTQKLNDAIIKIWQVAKTATESPSHSELIKLAQATERATRLLPQLLDSFSKDENVIYFLVRNHEQFDRVYGHGFIRQLCQKWHPQGVSGMQAFLLNRYEERGFGHLIAKIKSLMDDLEHSVP